MSGDDRANDVLKLIVETPARADLLGVVLVAISRIGGLSATVAFDDPEVVVVRVAAAPVGTEAAEL